MSNKKLIKSNQVKRLVLAALFLGIGFVLPTLTMQIKEIGDTLLPMHLPVMLCGLICGYKYGFFVGLILPFLRSVIFSMPPIYPNAVWMALELAAYGFIIGLLYCKLKFKNTASVYFCLIVSQLAGRIVWAITKAILLGVGGKAFTFEMFLIGGFVDAAPGILLQLIIIPSVMLILKKLNLKI